MGTPHKHAKLIKAWADGAKIQFINVYGRWEDTDPPVWNQTREYRIKPEPKKVQFRFYMISFGKIKCWTSGWGESQAEVEESSCFKHWLGPVEEREFDV